jgi:DNA-binding IclR family transcriptional regulator
MTQSPAQFAIRTMRALEILAFGPMTAPKLADHLGIHPRTARRLLSQLHQDGWLFHNRGFPPTYAPTLRLVALAANVGARTPLAAMTAPALEQLHVDTGRTAVLAIPAYDATVCLVRCVGDGAFEAPLGVITPAHVCAAGKVLLAGRECWRRSVLKRLSNDDAEVLESELERIRADGVAATTLGLVHQVAAPVGLAGEPPLAALAVVGPPASETEMGSLDEAVRQAVGLASEAFAHADADAPVYGAVTSTGLMAYGLTAVNACL